VGHRRARCHDDQRTLTASHGSSDVHDQHRRTGTSRHVEDDRSSKLVIRPGSVSAPVRGLRPTTIAAMASWLVALITGVLSAGGVVTGVVLTQHSERSRTHEDRLWAERASIYVEVLAWANDVNAWALRRTSGPGVPVSARPEPLARLQHARVLAFAGSAVRDSVETVDYELLCAPEPPEHAVRLHVQADALQDAIQQELQRRSRSRREQRRMGVGQGKSAESRIWARSASATAGCASG
jgi:hypothetical protein